MYAFKLILGILHHIYKGHVVTVITSETQCGIRRRAQGTSMSGSVSTPVSVSSPVRMN